MTRLPRSVLAAAVVSMLIAVCEAGAHGETISTPEKTFGAPPGLLAVRMSIENLIAQGRLDEAHAACQQGLAAATDDESRAFYMRYDGKAYMYEYSPKCVDAWNGILRQYPQTVQASWARLDLAEAYTEAARAIGPAEKYVSLALPVLDDFIRSYPHHERIAHALWLRGQCYERLENMPAALADYQKAGAANKTYGRADYYMLELLVAMHQWDEALASAERYLERFPAGRLAEGRMVRVMAYACKGDLPGALTEFEQFAGQFPDRIGECAREWQKLMDRSASSETCQATATFCRKLLEHHPDGDAGAFAKFGIAYGLTKAGDKDQAAPWYDRVLTEHPDSKVMLEAAYCAGWSLTWDNPTEAVSYLKQVVTKDTDVGDARWRLADAFMALGICYGQLKDYGAARAAYSEVIARKGDPYRYREPAAHLNLGIICYGQKQYEQAAAEFQTVISRWPMGEVADAARKQLAGLVRDKLIPTTSTGGASQ